MSSNNKHIRYSFLIASAPNFPKLASISENLRSFISSVYTTVIFPYVY